MFSLLAVELGAEGVSERPWVAGDNPYRRSLMEEDPRGAMSFWLSMHWLFRGFNPWNIDVSWIAYCELPENSRQRKVAAARRMYSCSRVCRDPGAGKDTQ